MPVEDIVRKDVISQYIDSPILLGFLEAFLKEAGTLDTEIKKVVSDRKLFNAYGIQLDILGSLVGAKREVIDFNITEFFGYQPDPTANPFDDLNSPNPLAGRYKSANEPGGTIRQLSDAEFLILINATIDKNISTVTPDEVLSSARKVLNLVVPSSPDAQLIFLETGNASYSLEIFSPVSAAEQIFIATLNLIPRPAGVKMTLIYS